MIIAFEGADKLGKTTQAKLLADKLNCEYIKFPNESLYSGKIIRQILNKELPFEPASFQALQDSNKRETVRRLDPDGKYIFDRFKLSEIVYGLVDGLPEEWVRENASLLPEPDFTIVFTGKPYGKDSDIYGEKQYEISQLYHNEIVVCRYPWIFVSGRAIEEVHDEILKMVGGLL